MGRSKRSKNYKKNIRDIERRSEGFKTKSELKKEKKELKKQQVMEKKYLVAIYDDFRRGGNNNFAYSDASLIGSYSTEPIYSMFDAAINDCVVYNRGNTSIKMEVWKINEAALTRLERQYCMYAGIPDDHQVYLKKEIMSPFGEAIIYFYNEDHDSGVPIIDGDWVEYCLYQSAMGNNSHSAIKDYIEGNKDNKLN